MEEDNMKKLAYIITAVCAIAVAAPSIASAETVVIKHGDHMHRDYHHAWHRDHGWRHHDKMVVIKHRHEG
jgi:Ni/Co efflux regulator RcnB